MLRTKFKKSLKVARIRREASRAYESQARHQGDILQRTRRLISRVLHAADHLAALGWGPSSENFTSIAQKLSANLPCYAEITTRYGDIFASIINLKGAYDESRAQKLHQLVDEIDYAMNSSRFSRVADVKSEYGAKAEVMWRGIEVLEEGLNGLLVVFSKESYTQRLSNQLDERLRRIRTLIEVGQI